MILPEGFGRRHAAFCIFALAFAALRLASPAAAAQSAAESDDAERGDVRAMALTWQLISDPQEAAANVSELAIRTLDLPPDLQDTVGGIGRAHADERAKALDALRRKYAEKVRAVLPADMASTYAEVLDALEELRTEAQAARDEFREAIGPAADSIELGLQPELATAAPMQLLDVDDATASALTEVRSELFATLSDALLERVNTEKLADVEAWREHRQRYARRKAEAIARYETRQAELLSPEQITRLQTIETAGDHYRERVQAARLRAYERIYAALRPRPDADEAE